ncbi:MAG: hypothetical protein KF878_00275 [Planctomycetes bacterium]|nr:hypothetical protein [Planctomycetota bacterium]
MNAFTEQQLNAILDAKEQREDLAGKTSAEIGEALRAEGHPAFAGAAPAAATSPAPATPAPAPVSPPRGAGLNLPPPRTLPGATPAPAPAPVVAQAVAVPPAAQHAPSPAPALPATREQHLPSTHHAAAPEGMEVLDQSDVTIPQLLIVHKTAEVDGAQVEEGNWMLSSSPEGASKGRLVQILDVQKWREWLLPYEKPREEQELRARVERDYGVKVPADRSVVCRSFDRVAPVDLGYGVIKPTCAECPHSQWTTIGGKREKPECGELYRLLVIDLDTGMPAFWRIRSTGIKPFKNALSLFSLATRKHPLYGSNAAAGLAPLAAFTVSLTLKRIAEKGKVVYYVPVFGRPQPITEQAEIDQALALRRAILNDPRMVEDEGHGAPAADESEAA